MLSQIDPDLLQGLRHVVPHGMFGDLQPVGDLGMRKSLLPDQLVDFSPLGGQLPDGLFEQGLYFAEILVGVRVIRIGRQLSRRIVLQLHIARIPLDIVQRTVGRHLIEIGRRMVDRPQLLPALPKS